MWWKYQHKIKRFVWKFFDHTYNAKSTSHGIFNYDQNLFTVTECGSYSYVIYYYIKLIPSNISKIFIVSMLNDYVAFTQYPKICQLQNNKNVNYLHPLF